MEALLTSYRLTGPTSMARNSAPYEFYVGVESPVQCELEPEPSLDYNTIYTWVLRLAPTIKENAVKKKFLDGFEHVAEARSKYHRCCLKYQKAHNELLDTSLFHKIMTGKQEEVEKQIVQWQEKEGMASILKEKKSELETIKWQIKMNDKKGPALFATARALARLKAQVSMHFVNMKVTLIKNYLPVVAALETRYWMEKQERATRIRMAKCSFCSHILSCFYADGQQGLPTAVQSTSETQALRRYHQATRGEIVNRVEPSSELARAIEEARIAVGKPSARPF